MSILAHCTLPVCQLAIIIDVTCQHKVVIVVISIRLHEPFADAASTSKQVYKRHGLSALYEFFFLCHFQFALWRAKLHNNCEKKEAMPRIYTLFNRKTVIALFATTESYSSSICFFETQFI
jgi:hypothetical protein